MNETIATTKQRIADTFGFDLEDIQSDFDLRQDLNASELELNDFIATLGHEFGIQMTADEVHDLVTVSDLYELLLDKLNEVG